MCPVSGVVLAHEANVEREVLLVHLHCLLDVPCSGEREKQQVMSPSRYTPPYSGLYRGGGDQEQKQIESESGARGSPRATPLLARYALLMK